MRVTEPNPKRLGVGRLWEFKLWYYSTKELNDVVLIRVERECEARTTILGAEAITGHGPSACSFVRRALDGYLKHLDASGRIEKEPERIPGNPDTSAILKCYATLPSSLRFRLVGYLKTLPPRDGLEWPHGSRRSSVIRQALRWWIRRHP